MKQDLDISNIQPKRKRVEQHKYDELAKELQRTKQAAEFVMQEADKLRADNAKLKSRIEDVTYKYRSWETYGLKCRDQRDMARFIAALLLIVSVGFAVAVWIGKLIPVV